MVSRISARPRPQLRSEASGNGWGSVDGEEEMGWISEKVTKEMKNLQGACWFSEVGKLN